MQGPIETTNTKWWAAERDEAGRRALALVQQVNQAQLGFHHDCLRHLRMYENRDYFSTQVSQYMVRAYSQGRRAVASMRSQKMALNVAKACIDTLVAKIGKERVKPVYLTNGGQIERRERCQKLNDWIGGHFQQTGIYQFNKSVLRCASIFGKSGIKTYIAKNDKGKYEVRSEPVFTPEILVDPYDAYYGNPTCLYQQKFITKDTLRSNPHFKGGRAQMAIDNALSVSNIAGLTAHDSTVVWEAWRRKVDGQVGKHLLFTDAGLLFEEDWDDCHFPVDFLDYTTPAIGFYGLGVCEELIPIQVEINRIVNHIRDSLMLCSNPRTYVPNGANIAKPMSNQIGGEWLYSGPVPPTTVAPSVVSPDTWRQLDVLYNRAFEIVGLNQMSVSGKNSLGASASGEAIRQYYDVQSDRFAELQQNWEDFHVSVARSHHRAAQRIVKLQGEYIVNCNDDDRGVWSLDFADIDVPNDSYTVQTFPKSALPDLPGPRLATIKEWKDEGYIDGDTARDLMDMPDLKSKTQYILAPRKVVERALEKMAYQPKPKSGEKWVSVVPEPGMDLTYSATLGAAMYNYLLLELPEDTDEERKEKAVRLDLIRQWNNRVDALGKMSTGAAGTANNTQAMMAPGQPVNPGQGPVGMPQQALSGMAPGPV